MATDSEILAVADAVSSVCDLGKSFQSIMAQALDRNDATQIDWGNIPAHLIDQDGTLKDRSYSPQDVSNALGAFAQFLNYWQGDPVELGNYGPLYELLSRPLTVRPTPQAPRPEQ